MANETSQSSARPDSRDAGTGLGALETLAANRSSGPIMGLDVQGMSAAPESNTPKGGGGGILGGQATPGSQIPGLGTPVQAPQFNIPRGAGGILGGQATPGSQIPIQAPAVTALPPDVFNGPRDCWSWAYEEPLGTGESYTWMFRIALYPNMTCQFVFVIQDVYAP